MKLSEKNHKRGLTNSPLYDTIAMNQKKGIDKNETTNH